MSLLESWTLRFRAGDRPSSEAGGAARRCATGAGFEATLAVALAVAFPLAGAPFFPLGAIVASRQDEGRTLAEPKWSRLA